LNLDRRSGYAKGYAFIEFENSEEAKKVIDEMNGSMLLGKKISVDWAFKKAS
jgi:RNA-binding protein 8A